LKAAAGYILDDQQIDRDIRRLKADLSSPPDVLVIGQNDFREHCIQKPWGHWFADDPDHMAHPYEAGLETFLAAHNVVYEVRKPKGAGWASRKHQLEAVERWYLHGWSRLDGRLRSSITEGVVVFLSLFDDSPAVHRAFCPPRKAYAEDPPPGEPKPLAPIDALLEKGKVLALNFPVGMNPGLARILSVMLKVDFQRAVLQRIPQITADRRARRRNESGTRCRLHRGCSGQRRGRAAFAQPPRAPRRSGAQYAVPYDRSGCRVR
jgi:hypothetical protein